MHLIGLNSKKDYYRNMNRGSVILLCITTLAIFFILKEKPKLDIKKYEDQIASLNGQIATLENENDSLMIESAVLFNQVQQYNSAIDSLNQEIDDIQEETKRKLDSIDRFTSDELQRFFAKRYGISK